MIHERHHPRMRSEERRFHKSAVKSIASIGGSIVGNMIAPGVGGIIGSAVGGAIGGKVAGGGGSSSGAVASGPLTAPPRTYYNALYGTRVREVKTANGIEMVQDVLYSDEDKAKLEELQGIYDEMLADIQGLTDIASAIDIPEFQPVVNALRENQRIAREDAYKQRAELEEEALARRGIEDSTASTEIRQQRGVALTKQAAQDARDLNLLAEDMRNQSLARSGELLTFASGQLRQDKQDRQTSLNQLAGLQGDMFNTENTIAGANWDRMYKASREAQADAEAQSGMGGVLGGNLFSSILKSGGGVYNAPNFIGNSSQGNTFNGEQIFWS